MIKKVSVSSVIFKVLASVGVFIFDAWVTQYLFNGIISAIFGITTITLMQGIGLSIFGAYWRTSLQTKTSEERTYLESLLYALLLNGMYLGVGSFVMMFI